MKKQACSDFSHSPRAAGLLVPVLLLTLLLPGCRSREALETQPASVTQPETATVPETVPETTVQTEPTEPEPVTLSQRVLHDFEGSAFWADFLENEGYLFDPETGEPVLDGWNPDALFYSVHKDGISSTLLLMSREFDKPNSRVWAWTTDSLGVPHPILEIECLDFVSYDLKNHAFIFTHAGQYGDPGIYYDFYNLTSAEPRLLLQSKWSHNLTYGYPECYVTQNGSTEELSFEEYQKRYGLVEAVQWEPLLPNPVVPDARYEDIASLLGRPIEEFQKKFTGLEALGSLPIFYSNGEVSATPDGEDIIHDISLLSPGIPCSILGVRFGMSIYDASDLITSYGGSLADSTSSAASFRFSDGSMLYLRLEESLQEPYVTRITLSR